MRLPSIFLVFVLSGIFSLLLPDAIFSQEQKSGMDRAGITHPELIGQMEHARMSVYPALVNISVVSQRFDGGRARRGPGAGSGVIVSPEGYVVTNYHVVGNTTRIICTTSDGKRFKAEVLVNDPLTDLSILKLDLDEYDGELPYAKIGDSDRLMVGDFVLAMGNPLALSSSMTLGIISNTSRVFTDFTGTEIQEMEFGDGDKTGIFTQWIQHDALILPGNSGGPLVNLQGEIVGINTRGGRGLGFAVPSVQMAEVYEAALAYGEVPRAWLGLRILPVEKAGHETGALISWVMPGSPAEKAGLKAGDRILSLNGYEIRAKFFEEVPLVLNTIASVKIEEELEIAFERKGERHIVRALPTKMEPFIGEQREVRTLGMTVQDITGPMALSRQLTTTEGVYVTGVRPGFPAEEARPRINSGDVIFKMNHQSVQSISDVFDLLGSLGEDQKSVPVHLHRDNEEIITVLNLDKSERRRGAGELPRSWLGLTTQVVTPEVANALQQDDLRGFRITEILKGTLAAESKLKRGDIITAVDDTRLEAYRQQDVQELRRVIERYPIGSEIVLSVVRNGESLRISVELESTPDDPVVMKRAEQEEFEFAVRETTFMDGIERRWPDDANGVIVSEVTNGGWAHVAGLRLNDLIVNVQGEPTGSIDEFEDIMDRLTEEKQEIITIFLYRGHRTHFVFIEPDWDQISR